MSNPLMTFLGVTQVRANGGDPLAVRPTLRLAGFALADDRARARALITPVAGARVALAVPEVPTGDYWIATPAWFGMTEAFDQATDVYVETAEDVRFAGFLPLTGEATSYARKTLINAGSNPFTVRNFRYDEDNGDYDDPGMVQGLLRVLAPGESCRLVWDPTGQRWLVNDGLVSGEMLTHDFVTLTHDGSSLTSS